MNDIFAYLDNSLDERGLPHTLIVLAVYLAVCRRVIPESPAIRTFSLPIFLPFSVKGRLLGILILGITNCGALPLSIILSGAISSSSPLEAMA